MTPLPNLKSFSVGRLVESFIYRTAPRCKSFVCRPLIFVADQNGWQCFAFALDLSTATVHHLINWLIAGMPSVENFSFGHGLTSMSRAEEKLFQYPPLPAIAPPGGEVLWPQTLKHLKLSNFALEASTFTSNNMEMPALKTILFKNCGNNVDSIINGLRDTHPGVRVTAKKMRCCYAWSEKWNVRLHVAVVVVFILWVCSALYCHSPVWHIMIGLFCCQNLSDKRTIQYVSSKVHS